jgi:hypothetical protein
MIKLEEINVEDGGRLVVSSIEVCSSAYLAEDAIKHVGIQKVVQAFQHVEVEEVEHLAFQVLVYYRIISFIP